MAIVKPNDKIDATTQNAEKILSFYGKMIDDRLANLFGASDFPVETATLYKAERYSLMSGGKRIRPVLVLSVCHMLGGNPSVALDYAAAVEMIHTYSLIHDDLPCMDNDDMRRGKPSNHRIFGEAGAVLAGDGLLTDAFGIAAGATETSASRNLRAVIALSNAAGSYGMVAGQSADLYADMHTLSEEALLELYRNKTVRLIRVSVYLGAVAAGLEDHDPRLALLLRFADNVGLAFQIIDDILDKGEDGRNHYLSFHTVDEAESYAAHLTDEALHALAQAQPIPELAQPVDILTRWLLQRNH